MSAHLFFSHFVGRCEKRHTNEDRGPRLANTRMWYFSRKFIVGPRFSARGTHVMIHEHLSICSSTSGASHSLHCRPFWRVALSKAPGLRMTEIMQYEIICWSCLYSNTLTSFWNCFQIALQTPGGGRLSEAPGRCLHVRKNRVRS